MNKLLTTMYALAVASATTFLPAAHAQEVKGDAKAGEKKIAMCIGCHGIVGYQASFPEVYKVPKISGQSGKYIATSLAAYKAGDRKHPTMRGIADTLSEQDIADVSAYYEQHGKDAAKTLPDKPSREPSAQVAALLQKGICVSCHGANFSKPIDPSYPKIAGQNADYLFVALKSYKTENNATIGRSNGVMAGVAKQFSNAELKALANYIGSLDGELKTVPEPRFR
ncbi:c-type cytochrome [uncultured Xylophilus sp.]|uniref:c-type cytochrome n=1 Tax=uncultured Xylophilus sp. TaxID=296832 RepID=UPI0025FCB5FA|nr:c-type cytochrome [uncultured Xylophilus sp.]